MILKRECVGATMDNLNQSVLGSIPFLLPPLSEQKRIVNAVERWFAVIDALGSNEGDLLKAIDKAKSKILDLAIHGKLVPQDPNDEPAIELLKRINPKFEACDNTLYKFEIPQSWCLCRIGSIANIIGGVSYKKEDIQVNGIRILRGGNVQDGKIIIADNDVFVSESYYNIENEVKSGDIVVVASTGSTTIIGKTGYVINVPAHTQIGAFLRIIRPNQQSSSCFINYIFLTDEYRTYIRNIAKGSNINNIKNNHLSEYIIALPPYQEQLRIVAKIEELFAVLDSIKESLEA
jgi:type I restriction enzyme S subunit